MDNISRARGTIIICMSCALFLWAYKAVSLELGNGADDGGGGSNDSNTAIGASAQALPSGSVAIGYLSVASDINTVSVGSPGSERRVMNIADGTNSTDAVNLRQLVIVQDQANVNTGNIGTNTTNITTNTGNIGTNASNISTNTGNIGTNATNISTNTGNIGTNTTNISTNTGNIGTNTTNISTNTGDIGTNATDITTNTGNIGTNTTNITTNAISIQDLVIHTAPLSSGSTGASSALGVGSLAVGPGASARSYDTAVGYNSVVTADGSTALGANTRIESSNSVAVGADAVVESGASGGTAIGQNSRILSGATNSVAIGKNSVASEPDTVSIGSPGNERRVTNVASGIYGTDAVNMNQLNRTNAQVDANTGNIAYNRSNINQNRSDINKNRDDINTLSNSLNDLKDESRAGIAAAAALIELMPTSPGKTTFNIGSAAYKGELAVGFTAVHRLSAVENLMLNTGLSFADDSVLVRAGVSWEF